MELWISEAITALKADGSVEYSVTIARGERRWVGFGKSEQEAFEEARDGFLAEEGEFKIVRG